MIKTDHYKQLLDSLSQIFSSLPSSKEKEEAGEDDSQAVTVVSMSGGPKIPKSLRSNKKASLSANKD